MCSVWGEVMGPGYRCSGAVRVWSHVEPVVACCKRHHTDNEPRVWGGWHSSSESSWTAVPPMTDAHWSGLGCCWCASSYRTAAIAHRQQSLCQACHHSLQPGHMQSIIRWRGIAHLIEIDLSVTILVNFLDQTLNNIHVHPTHILHGRRSWLRTLNACMCRCVALQTQKACQDPYRQACLELRYRN